MVTPARNRMKPVLMGLGSIAFGMWLSYDWYSTIPEHGEILRFDLVTPLSAQKC